MKAPNLYAVIVCLGLGLLKSPAAETYTLDPAHSTVGFAVTHMVINTVHGKFDEFTGTISMDGTQVKDATGTIQVKSINTGIERRDNHLKSADFFDAAKFPMITFQTKRAEKQGSDTVLVGDFTMHGVTKELSLPVTIKGPIKDPWGNSRIGLQARTKLNRRDYGLKYNQALETGALVVGDEVELEINAEAVKAK
jgi:polyisoprenoid-binding protein YceI